MKVFDQFHYDKKNVIRCLNFKNVMFYVQNETTHVCINKDKTSVKINESLIKNKDKGFLCKIGNIQNKCPVHNREFQYYKERNYYCSSCVKGKNINEYLNLDQVVLSKEEIEKFKELIVKSENVMKKIIEKIDNFISKLKF